MESLEQIATFDVEKLLSKSTTLSEKFTPATMAIPN